eukprot:tig00000344_g24295.t1
MHRAGSAKRGASAAAGSKSDVDPKFAKERDACLRKCVATCIRPGDAPGDYPLNIRKSPIALKEGFRSRKYCLERCGEACQGPPFPKQ